jgi:hypothetical protein
MPSKGSSLGLLLSALAALALPAAAQTYKAPRNAHGQPDLQGVWTNATITPLERDVRLGERLVLTPQEAAALEGATADRNAEAAKPTDPKLGIQDLPVECAPGFRGTDCGYNNFWVDPGTKVININGERRASILVEPKNGRLPAIKPEARARLAARFQRNNFDGPEVRALGERCIVSFGSSAGPPMLPLLYNNTYQIIQTPTEVMILVEMVHDVRVIRIGAKPLPDRVKQWMGDSTGWWEGDTLVVETRNLRPEQAFRGASPGLKVTERLTRINAGQILYRFTVDDPATYEAPFTGEVAMNATKGPIYEYACHEGNYALAGILGGARQEERAGKQTEGARGEIKGEGE